MNGYDEGKRKRHLKHEVHPRPLGSRWPLSLTLALPLLLAAPLAAQQARTARPWSPPDSAVRGINLAADGHCERALALLQHHLPAVAGKRLRYRAALASAQCGMSLDREDAVMEALELLNREFPSDPKVLYTTTHDFSELADRAAQRLLNQAPQSAEAQELIAEAMVARGQYQDATAAYRKILAQYPNQPGIHYQLGRILLAKPMTPEIASQARAEFEAELKVDPASPETEFMLGDMAFHDKNAPEAIRHFRRAIQIDAGFTEAYLGLGMALNAVGKYAEAAPSLEKYVAAAPDDPAGHYQLFLAYGRSGDKAKAQQQLALAQSTQAAHRRAPATTEDLLQPH